MPDHELKNLLEKLHEELASTDKVEAETLALVRKLDADIHKLVESSGKPETFDLVLDRARMLRNRFAIDHPVAERFMTEIMDTLAKLGI